MLALAGLVAAVVILYLGRETIFFYDDWGFVFERRDVSLDSLLTPHNGHLVFVPTLIYKVLFVTAGMSRTGPIGWPPWRSIWSARDCCSRSR